jgi:hypothetical protein
MERYKELHKSLDALVADMMARTGKLPSKTTVMELMQWSAEQLAAPEPQGMPPLGSVNAYWLSRIRSILPEQ